MDPIVSAKAKLIQIDPDGNAIGRNRGVDVGIVGDVDNIVKQLANEASKHSWTKLPWLDVLAKDQEKQKENQEENAVAGGGGAVVSKEKVRRAEDRDRCCCCCCDVSCSLYPQTKS